VNRVPVNGVNRGWNNENNNYDNDYDNDNDNDNDHESNRQIFIAYYTTDGWNVSRSIQVLRFAPEDQQVGLIVCL
jgi:hypothetical protein